MPKPAKDLDAAEVVFMTCALTPERAAALRVELEHNKVASVETGIDDAVSLSIRSEPIHFGSGNRAGDATVP